MNNETTVTEEDLFAGYDAYMASEELGLFEDDTPDAATNPATPTLTIYYTIRTPC